MGSKTSENFVSRVSPMRCVNGGELLAVSSYFRATHTLREAKNPALARTAAAGIAWRSCKVSVRPELGWSARSDISGVTAPAGCGTACYCRLAALTEVMEEDTDQAEEIEQTFGKT